MIMPRTEFSALPDEARLWVFACEPPPAPDAASRLIQAVDEFLNTWQAHGHPLTCARDWRDNRFLAVAVDQSTAGASGCSIDGLFNTLRSLEKSIGSRVVGGGSVFYRAADGSVHCVSRDAFARLARDGDITPDTPVFDSSITSAAEWRNNFERRAENSWHASLFPTSQHQAPR
jgi:hypothetical protein